MSPGATALADTAVSLAHSPEVHHSINQRIFDTSLDLILVVDRHGTFLRVSPSTLATLGYRPDEMVGRSARDFVHPDDLESTRDNMRLARRGRTVRTFECRYVRRDGRPVPIAWKASGPSRTASISSSAAT